MGEQKTLTDGNVQAYLVERGILPPDVRASVVPAGDGNINWVRRVSWTSTQGTRRGVRPPQSGPENLAGLAADVSSIVVKQARPSLERFPEYQVTTDRILFEARYYERVRHLDERSVCPRILAFDERERVLILEDLGEVERLDAALARGADTTDCFRTVASFLASVHAGLPEHTLAGDFQNDAMRKLHGDHIFMLPLSENEFSLSERLQKRADRLAQERDLAAIARATYARYLDPHGALVHGDPQAGNILLCESGPKLLDAEIAHVGDPAFDLGTLLAHALLSCVARGRPEESEEPVAAAWDAYRAAHGPAREFAEVLRYAGFEILRRTIGAARLPAVGGDEVGCEVLETAVRLIRVPPPDPDVLAAMLQGV